ncbi:MAG: zinc protease [Rhodothermales bacterium]|jgi:zinc protease
MAIADRTRRTHAGPVDLALLPTAVKDVVTIRGSIDTSPSYAAGGELAQEWMVRTLDKGTTSRDRFEVASVLENLGAQLGFSGSAARVRFSARCLRADVRTVIELLFEQLKQPALDESELTKSRDRLLASIQRGIADAGYRADVALSQAVYAPSHPNYMYDPAEEKSLVESLTNPDVKTAHAAAIAGSPRMVIVGDLDVEACSDMVGEIAADWTVSTDGPIDAPQKAASPVQLQVPIADRDNLEVRWGHAMPIKRLDDDFLPAYMASFILGGNFSARLMNEVREKRGLTYGIGSGLRGLDSRYDGMWRMHVTLSQDNLDRGIKATEEVVRAFRADGITDEELAEKQQTIAGSYQVRMASTAGLAGALLQQMEDGRPLSWVDSYTDRIRACSLERVNGAIEAHFRPENLSRVVSGTIPD